MAAILVTGAGGFIGSHVVTTARAAGHRVVTVAHRWSSMGELSRAVGGRRVDIAVHLGWYAAPRDYVTSVGRNQESLRATVELARLLPQLGCERLVAVGSCAEYGPSSRPLRELDRLDPATPYGVAKATAAAALAQLAAENGTTTTWARLFGVTGPGDHPGRLLPLVRDRLTVGDRVELTDGRQVRDYLDVADVADALVHLATRSAPGPVNVGSGVGVSVRVLAARLGEALGRQDLLNFGARPRGAAELEHVVADSSLLRSTGWSPRIGLDEMLRRLAGAGRVA